MLRIFKHMRYTFDLPKGKCKEYYITCVLPAPSTKDDVINYCSIKRRDNGISKPHTSLLSSGKISDCQKHNGIAKYKINYIVRYFLLLLCCCCCCCFLPGSFRDSPCRYFIHVSLSSVSLAHCVSLSSRLTWIRN